MKGQPHPILSASAGRHAAAAPGSASGATGAPRYLTTATLASRWRVAPYTIREWARAGRITDAEFVRGEWVFFDTSRLRISAKGATVPSGERLLDLADYPMTVADLAASWGRAEDTVRRWNRAGLLAPAVHTPAGWRFGAEVADPSKPQPKDASGQAGAVGAPGEPEADDPLAELRSLSFEVRWAGPPASGRTPRSPSAAAYAEHRKNARMPRALYRR
jgi:hypothetical protein